MNAKINLIWCAALTAAVVILFMRPAAKTHTPSHSSDLNEAPIISAFSDTGGTRSPIVAYVNGDSINEHYQFIKEKSAGLEAGLKRANSKVQAEYDKRQKEVGELMQYAQGKQLPDDERRVIQERLMQLEDEMADIEDREKGALMKQEAELQKELHKRVNKFLDTFAREKGIDYVLNYQESIQLILYGSGAYDITREVLRGLNDEYEEEKKKKK